MKRLVARRLLSIAVALLPALAFAQSAKIENGLNSAANWLVGIGLSVGTCGLVISGMRMNAGEEEGKDMAKRVFVGSVTICCASMLMGLIKLWFLQ